MTRYLVSLNYTDSLGRRCFHERTFFFEEDVQRWIDCYKHNYNNLAIRIFLCELRPYTFGVAKKVRVRY